MSNQGPENNNLINFIATTVETMRDQMGEVHAKIGDMRGQMGELRDQMEEMRDEMGEMRGQMATKSDLAQLEARLTNKLEAEITAVRGDIEQVHLRLDSIERALRARLDQIETEVSRLRSVVYLLVKDRPEMLRLLGETPPLSDEGRT
jgi:chromosome segregation ATPase